MPYFNPESFCIEPAEYVSECRKKEIRELLTEIKDNHEDLFEEAMEEVADMIAIDKIDKIDKRTDVDGSYQQCLRVLSSRWTVLSLEDEEVIRKIGKKYGAV